MKIWLATSNLVSILSCSERSNLRVDTGKVDLPQEIVYSWLLAARCGRLSGGFDILSTWYGARNLGLNRLGGRLDGVCTRYNCANTGRGCVDSLFNRLGDGLALLGRRSFGWCVAHFDCNASREEPCWESLTVEEGGRGRG